MVDHTRRFDGRSVEYAQYRERYDANLLLPLLREWCGLTAEWTVADIGAGTGMLSDVFLENGNKVVAVEPNAEMREMCARLHKDNRLITVVNGGAEATTLGDAAVELVSVGRALHWFDLERAVAEFRRILKPAGWVAVVAFGRSQTGREENGAFERLLREKATGHKDSHAGYTVYQRMEEYLGADFRHEEIRGTMSLDWQELYGMTMSLSHAPLMDHPKYASFERALVDYFGEYAVGGRVTLETRYWINAGRFGSRLS